MTNGETRPSSRAVRAQSDVVVEEIKRMIINGELSPGARLPVEKDLAAQLRVSRSSLREGVRALVLTGVLETRQGDGTYVTALDPVALLSPISFLVDLQRSENIADLQYVRRVLEMEAVGRAALRITDEELARAERILSDTEEYLEADRIDHDAVMNADIMFHRVITAASGNPTLQALVEALASRTVRARLWRAINEDGAELRTHEEHKAILAALKMRDPDAARLRMGVHLLAVEQYLSVNLDTVAGAEDQESVELAQ